MEYRPLGRTGVMVSSLCLGVMNFGGVTNAEDSIAMIDRALDAGINFIDTANVYNAGESEIVLGKALKANGKRESIVLATKVNGAMGEGLNDRGISRYHIMKACEDSLRRLQTDHIDLYQLHGGTIEDPIDETIEAFKDKKIDILVSTTVIEVGIDIPNATIMVIEEAQRFGLSQLHQLRGRVGRGADQSYCILISDKQGEISSQRLKVMTETNDGFVISETDMRLRGPGEFFGIRQSGELKFSAADLGKDMELIEKARNSAFSLIEKDPELRSNENLVVREHFLTNYEQSMELIRVA